MSFLCTYPFLSIVEADLITFYFNENLQVPFKVIRFEMDETELIFVGDIPFFGASIVGIDFLSTPPTIETGRTTSSGSLSNGDEAMWRFTIAKEIGETLNL